MNEKPPERNDSERRRGAGGVGADPQKPGRPTGRLADFGSILVVDDNPDAVDILCRLLEVQQLRTIPAYSGQQCLEIARAEPVDLILLDVAMPGMDGLVVCTELGKDERTKTIPIILITALDDHETRVAGMKLGVSEFLAKPVNRTELMGRVRSQLAARAQARQMDQDIEKTPGE
jgi:two-component system, cell cycle response regulator